MQRLEVSGAVRLIYRSLGVKGLKNGWQNAVLLWCMLQAVPPSLHYYCAVVLHSCIVLPPVGHSSDHQYHCCQLTRQSSCVSNFYRTFKVFIWLSLVVANRVKKCVHTGVKKLKQTREIFSEKKKPHKIAKYLL